MKVKVLDAIMGSGKTTRLIDMISKMHPSEKIIYITPLLSECHRIAGTVPVSEEDNRPMSIEINDYYYESNHPISNRRFRHPLTSRQKDGTKLDDFKHLVTNGCNIVSTHALFAKLTKEIISIIEDNQYILILDEVLTMYEQYDGLDNATLRTCFSNGWMYLEDDKLTLRWNHEKGEYTDVFELDEIGRLCDNGQLLLIDEKAVMIEFPIHTLKCFKEVHIATYMFNGSQMKPYLEINNIEVEVEKFGKKPSEFKHLINIIKDKKMTSLGDNLHSFSYSSLEGKKDSPVVDLNELHKKLNTFFTSKTKTKIEDRLWTTYKFCTRAISKGRYSKSWLAHTTKATNEYSRTWAVAYLINKYPSPMIEKLLCYKDVKIDRDLYAIGEMVQFIWRSRIRDNQPIDLYIPSRRMREYLIDWLNDKYV